MTQWTLWRPWHWPLSASLPPTRFVFVQLVTLSDGACCKSWTGAGELQVALKAFPSRCSAALGVLWHDLYVKICC